MVFTSDCEAEDSPSLRLGLTASPATTLDPAAVSVPPWSPLTADSEFATAGTR